MPSLPDRRVLRSIGAAALAALFLAPAGAGEVAPEALDALPAARVVILGEVHDNPAHHRLQARALRAMAPAAVAFEMLDAGQAETVNDSGRTGAALAEAIGWGASGWPDWALYAPVFEARGAARVYGLAVPRPALRTAMQEGAAAAFEGDPARFGLDRPLPAAEQAAREADQMAAHCDALPEAMAAGMVAAQRLRDAAFAQTVLRALDETGGPVAVITGNGHARRDRGMPSMLAAAAPGLSVLSVGLLEDNGAPPVAPPFDLWLRTDPAPRPDPCAAFESGG